MPSIAGFDLSGLTSGLLSWVINPLIWLILLIFFMVGVFVILIIRKKKKMIYPTIELVDLGHKKLGYNNLKSGYVGKKSHFKGLWWSGAEVLKTETGEEIRDFSTEDFQEINGKRGVMVYRDPLNQNILVPITQTRFINKELVADIAPASYRDVAVDIFNEAVKETSDWKDKIMQFVSWALVVIFSLVAIIVITQMVKNGQDKSAQLLLQAGQAGADACKAICANAVNVIKSGGLAP